MMDKQTNIFLFGRAIFTGFIGGIIASIFSIIMYYFNFSEVVLSYYLFLPMIKITTSFTWVNYLISIIIASIFSAILAIVYYGLFRKINSMWIGLVYGLCLWIILFIFLQPIYPDVQKLQEWHTNTIVSTLSLFLLYGTFIGYSISHDYHDTIHKPSNIKD